jgi:hypothetical protein
MHVQVDPRLYWALDKEYHRRALHGRAATKGELVDEALRLLIARRREDTPAPEE